MVVETTIVPRAILELDLDLDLDLVGLGHPETALDVRQPAYATLRVEQRNEPSTREMRTSSAKWKEFLLFQEIARETEPTKP